MSGLGVIAIFAKPPRPGMVKTRLAATLGPERAAALAAAFLEDTLSLAASMPGAQVVVASTEDDRAALNLADTVPLWLQGAGDLGARQERICIRALDAGAPWVVAIGADSPGLPATRLHEAMAALAHGQAVLGPADDGGYYLLGLCACPKGLLAGLPWSSAETAARTRARLVTHGMTPRELAPWFDVDEPADLQRLRGLLATQEILAPATAALLGSAG
jgi:rSAM/selenodomain-associated transferase 1